MVNCESYRFSRRLTTKWKMNRSINLNCALFENVYLPLKSICIIQIDINFLVNVTFYGFFIAKHSKGEREKENIDFGCDSMRLRRPTAPNLMSSAGMCFHRLIEKYMHIAHPQFAQVMDFDIIVMRSSWFWKMFNAHAASKINGGIN